MSLNRRSFFGLGLSALLIGLVEPLQGSFTPSHKVLENTKVTMWRDEHGHRHYYVASEVLDDTMPKTWKLLVDGLGKLIFHPRSDLRDEFAKLREIKFVIQFHGNRRFYQLHQYYTTEPQYDQYRIIHTL